jgi:hypothetical protein
MAVKLSAKLSDRINSGDSADFLDVILELRPQAGVAQSKNAASRTEKIAALKEAFNRDVEPVEEIVRKVGGEVTGRAWINHTLRARVPAQGLEELAEHETIAAVDIPHAITPDA